MAVDIAACSATLDSTCRLKRAGVHCKGGAGQNGILTVKVVATPLWRDRDVLRRVNAIMYATTASTLQKRIARRQPLLRADLLNGQPLLILRQTNGAHV